MKKALILIYLFLSINLQAQTPPSHPQFSQDLEELQAYFQIPGLASLVLKDDQVLHEAYFGLANRSTNLAVDKTVAFPIASLSKIFSAILLHQLQEEGQLSFSDPVRKYLPQSELSEDILIEHLLSHTSQGKPGQHFYYSFRFGLLTPIIEAAAGKDYATLIEERIIKPLQLKHTYLLKDEAEWRTKDFPLAQPYAIEEGIAPSHIEYGYSASAGVVSTARDLARLDQAINQQELLSAAATASLLSPYQEGLPYGLGIFNQRFAGLEVQWGYGQYDAYSSLYLRVPEQKLTLILLANNNLMSDPARLIYGEVGSSLFALSFFRNFIYTPSQSSILDRLPLIEGDPSFFTQKQLRAQGLAFAFMARFDPEEWQRSVEVLEQLFQKYPSYLDYGDLNLMHHLSFLKSAAMHLELGPFDRYDTELAAIGQKLLTQDPDHPYVHYYLGNLADFQGDLTKAHSHFQHLVDLQNFTPHWYTREAAAWLKNH